MKRLKRWHRFLISEAIILGIFIYVIFPAFFDITLLNSKGGLLAFSLLFLGTAANLAMGYPNNA